MTCKLGEDSSSTVQYFVLLRPTSQLRNKQLRIHLVVHSTVTGIFPCLSSISQPSPFFTRPPESNQPAHSYLAAYWHRNKQYGTAAGLHATSRKLLGVNKIIENSGSSLPWKQNKFCDLYHFHCPAFRSKIANSYSPVH